MLCKKCSIGAGALTGGEVIGVGAPAAGAAVGAGTIAGGAIIAGAQAAGKLSQIVRNGPSRAVFYPKSE